MKRTKAPALTSPSKIGFFVSLMLVLVSIGVTYFFTRRFGVTWNILDRNWLDRNEWLGLLRGEGFLFEMLPLIGLVAVMSMFAYIVISGAVRKYKRYLDSGCDYRNLLSSLKDLDDLEDKRKIDRIKNHPELKRLLLGLVETFEEKERLLREREGALETRLQDALGAKEAELTGGFQEECKRLAMALENGKVDPSAIEFSNPGLRALGEIMGRAPARGSEQALDAGDSRSDADRTSRALHSRLRETADELRMAGENAQVIEARLRTLVGSKQHDAVKPMLDAARKEIKAVVTSLTSLEQLNLTIDSLSEEARGIAINTALHAGSGMGAQEDLIRLAEEVKEIAARFKEAAKRFAQTSSALRTSAGILGTIAGEPIGHPEPSAQPEEDLAGVLSRVSLWVERVVVLSDKVSNLTRSHDISTGPLHEGAGEEIEGTASGETSVEETPEEVDLGFESLDRARSLFSDTEESSEVDLETSGPGEPELFEEIPEEPARAMVDTGDEERVDEDRSVEAEGRLNDTDDETVAAGLDSPAEAPRRDREPAGERAPQTTSDHSPLGEDREVVEPAPETAEGDVSEETPPATHGEERPEAEAAELEEEPVDLYALGAVDYDPALHG